MASIDATRRVLDNQAHRVQNYMDNILTDSNADGTTIEDVNAFVSAMQYNAAANWAKGMDLQVKHSIAKNIINGIQ